MSPDGNARYRIAYETEKLDVKKSIWAKMKSVLLTGKGGKVKLESDYTAATSNPREWIELNLKELSRGKVRLKATVRDLVSGQVAEPPYLFR